MTKLTQFDGMFAVSPAPARHTAPLLARFGAGLRARSTRRWLSLVVVIIAAYAAGAAPDDVSRLGAAAAALAALAGFAYQERAGRMYSRHDQQLYRRFISDLPSHSPAISWLRDANAFDPTTAEIVATFERFLRNWDNAESEFDNEYLGSYLRGLRRVLAHLLYALAEQPQITAADADTLAVLRLRRDLAESSAPATGSTRDQLAIIASAAWRAHQDLVWQGRRQL